MLMLPSSRPSDITPSHTGTFFLRVKDSLGLGQGRLPALPCNCSKNCNASAIQEEALWIPATEFTCFLADPGPGVSRGGS
jgi:hypothetical protein